MIDLTRAITEEKEYAPFLDALKTQCAPEYSGARRPVVVTGLCEGAEFALVNTLHTSVGDLGYDLILLLVADEKKANRLCSWLAAHQKRAHIYFGRDLVFHSTSASHEFEHERLFVLSKLIKGEIDYLITTPDALLQYTVPPIRLRAMEKTVSVKNPCLMEELVSTLENAGYHRADMVESVGQYSKRGSIVDIFSPSCANPVRIDYFDDEIDRMGYFDVMTQRRIENCEEFTVMPIREVVADEAAKKRIASCIKGQLKGKTSASPAGQRLKEELECIESGREATFLDKYLPLVYPEKKCLLDYLGYALPVVCEYGACMNRMESRAEIERQQLMSYLEDGTISSKNADFSRSSSELESYLFSDAGVLLSGMGSRLSGHKYAGTFSFNTKQTTGYADRFDLLCDDLRGYMSAGFRVKLICETESSAANLEKMLVSSGFGAYKDSEKIKQKPSSVALCSGVNIPGFELTASRYVCLTELATDTVKKRSNRSTAKRKKDKNLQQILSYADMSVGDFVVHDIHGIGQYLGMSSLTVEGNRKDFLKIKYAGKDMLYLPCNQLDKISKYIGKGAEEGDLKLSKMGGADWKKVKIKAKLSAQSMAKQLIALYAERIKKDGVAFPKDDEMQREFESAFEYEETDCQLAAAEDVKKDMERKHPMDRLLCGDVGYGKTEVAMRAAFKAVNGGYQVAILVPTTILCMQHYRSFLSRMRGFPVSVDMVCRFRSKKEIEESIRKLRRGETDIIIGTHRLLSKDVEFKKLGLLIVDEEQRFGVAHKEKLKELSKNVDVLTLSATPIPRTMNMAMSGIRDMSVLDEAPCDRMPVQTFVLEHDDGVIEEAIRRELRRGGQVFYLCNSVEQMPDKAAKLQNAFPDVRVEYANGQMDKDQLSDIWEEMIKGEIDILVSTTIIETGVDVPNANTLIIERADKLGLSQLHQIRGRVGRSSRRAYAYFTYPAGRELREISEKRLSAIRDFTEFGSGFRIAMRDMEIRGVGNLLGAEQHGHMESIGYDLYMKLLSEAVSEEKGEVAPKKTECSVEMQVDAYIPESYISNPNQRIDAYKKISLIENAEDLSDVYDELQDRYGDPPVPVLNILTVSHLRAMGASNGIGKIVSKGTSLLFYPEEPSAIRMTKLAAGYNGRVMVSLSGAPYFSLRVGSSSPSKMAKECVALLDAYAKIEN